ncbi:MAG: alpha-L-fucosidase [Flavobacteriaceae bacterium]
MKSIKLVMLSMAFLLVYSVEAQHSGGGEANPDLKTNKEALKKFKDLRFGMFIHWGPVTLRGTEIGWSRGRNVPIEEYDNLYKEFNPVLFNAKAWVKAAKDAGMKYIVLTTRHHDGFSLWDSAYTDYDMANTPYGKGVLQQLVDECKKQGIVFGAYYSICDWRHADYPVVYPSDDYTFHDERVIKDPEIKKKMDNYIVFIKNQLKELIENYDPAFIWFDGEWEWAWTHEMGMDLYQYVRGLKDDILINNRVDKGREGMSGTTKSAQFAGDYATPEQEVGKFDNKNTWETCMTIGEQWAWKANDKMKSKKECIQTLLQTVGGDGNLLFNVGPMADGRIEQRQIDRLKEMGDWLNINGESVYETHGGPYLPTKRMVSTHKDNKIYLHLFNGENKSITLPFVKGIKIKKAYFLDGNTSVQVDQGRESFTINLPEILPDDIASVIVLELNKQAQIIDVIQRINY